MCGRERSASASQNNPSNPTFRGRSYEDTISDITDAFRFCGMEVLPSFGIFDIFKNPTIEEDLGAYREHLAKNFTMFLPDVIAILSGMSIIEQVRDNIDTFEHAKPLTEDERKLLECIVHMYKETEPLKTADFSKYGDILRHGVPVSSILDLYNTALIQPDPNTGCHICYLKNSIAEQARLDNFGEMPQESATTADGEDVTAMVDEAETWLIKRSCT